MIIRIDKDILINVKIIIVNPLYLSCIQVDTRISDGGIVDQTDESYQKAVRQMKLYSLLSSRNKMCSNVQYFYDVPVEFLPDMLRSIEQYSEYHVGDNKPDQEDDDSNALSITFEVMRRLDKVFSVYEFLSCSD